ncbi:MAG: DUF1987 domain-containing protein [Bacteroidetes bacterium]|nr:DUF1987 domain-containing protein [Bacteroidota bacterium]
MNPLNIEGTSKTPFVSFSADDGVLEMSGKSIPENSIEFYQPLYHWLDQYLQLPAKTTTVKIQLEYFNTSSSKCLLDVFRKLEAVQKSGRSEVTVMWMYEEEDEDMMEAGDDYQSIVSIPFRLTKVTVE